MFNCAIVACRFVKQAALLSLENSLTPHQTAKVCQVCLISKIPANRKLQVVEEDNSGGSHANLGRFCLLVRSYGAYSQRIGAVKTIRTVHFLHRSELAVPFLLNRIVGRMTNQ